MRQDLITQPICGWPGIRPDGHRDLMPLPLTALRCHHSQLNKIFMNVQWATNKVISRTDHCKEANCEGK